MTIHFFLNLTIQWLPYFGLLCLETEKIDVFDAGQPAGVMDCISEMS